jgi:hypothetical protein
LIATERLSSLVRFQRTRGATARFLAFLDENVVNPIAFLALRTIDREVHKQAQEDAEDELPRGYARVHAGNDEHQLSELMFEALVAQVWARSYRPAAAYIR